MTRFALVETRFPTNRLADDARFRAALAVFDEGDEARYLSMLSSLPDAYPDGDMKGEALFRVALTQLGKSDLGEARAALDRLLALPSRITHGARQGAGRTTGPAFRSSLAIWTTPRRAMRAIIAEQPFAFYMLMAYARLGALDDAKARGALQAAAAREPAGPFLTAVHPELAAPPFERFTRLLEVGEIDAARHEAAAGGWSRKAPIPRCSGPRRGSMTARARRSSVIPSRARGCSTTAVTGRLDAGSSHGRWPFRARGTTRRFRERVGRHSDAAHLGHHARGSRRSIPTRTVLPMPSG